MIKENANLSRNEISEFLKENPLLMTSDLYKIKEHLDFLSKLKKEVIEVCEKNIQKSKVKRIMDREDIEKRIKLGSKVEEDIKLPVEEEILNFSMFDFIKLNPYYLLTSPTNFIEIFTIFKEKLDYANANTLPFTHWKMLRVDVSGFEMSKHKFTW